MAKPLNYKGSPKPQPQACRNFAQNQHLGQDFGIAERRL